MIIVFRFFFPFVMSGFCVGCFSWNHEPAGTLHVFSPVAISSLDPIHSKDEYSNVQVAQAYESLLGYHYLKRPYVLVPRLLEAMPTISEAGFTYTFRLKQGVLFQDDPAFVAMGGKGRELIASDVEYSWKRLADPKLLASGWWVFDDKILGLNEWRKKSENQKVTDYHEAVEGIKVLDRYTIRITLVRPCAPFLYFLAMPYTSIVAHEVVEYYGVHFPDHPVGTGPFRLVKYDPQSKMIWDRNPTYRQVLYPKEGEPQDVRLGLLKDAGKFLPLVERVVVHVMQEAHAMWLYFLSGKLDLAPVPKDEDAHVFYSEGTLRPEFLSKGMQFHEVPAFDIVYVAFNMEDPWLGKNRLLRQALSLAIDSKTFLELFYHGRGTLAKGPIPPGLLESHLDIKNPWREFDLSKSKKMLAKAGFPEGRGLPVWEYASTTAGRQQAEYLHKMLAAIGVRININVYDWPYFLEAIKNKKFQMYSFVWEADYPDAENFFQLFYSKNTSTSMNIAHYSNPKWDALYEQTLIQPSSQAFHYPKMLQWIIEDCPWIFYVHRSSTMVSQKWIQNYKKHHFDYGVYQYYRIVPERKRKRS
jgi:ABC-type transport system substrate-binding protein